jgi:hypothetical protein
MVEDPIKSAFSKITIILTSRLALVCAIILVIKEWREFSVFKDKNLLISKWASGLKHLHPADEEAGNLSIRLPAFGY